MVKLARRNNLPNTTGFLPEFFLSGGGKIYCYANFSLALGLNFREGQNSLRELPSPVEESQHNNIFKGTNIISCRETRICSHCKSCCMHVGD